MTDPPEHSHIHVRSPLAHKRRLQALAKTLSKRTAGCGSAAGPLTVSDLVRACVITLLLSERTDITETDKHELTEWIRGMIS